MSDKNNQPPRGVRGAAKDARSKFAELLGRAERNGERIRLTRRGTPIAYIVPLEDGERLRRYDDMARRMEDRAAAPPPNPAQPQLPDLPELPPMPEPPQPKVDHTEDMQLLDHGDETERHIAISAFKKTVLRILTDTQELKRGEMRDRFKDDKYIGTAMRKIIGEGKV